MNLLPSLRCRAQHFLSDKSHHVALEIQSIGEFSKIIAVSLTSPTGTGGARNASLIIRGPSFLPKPDLDQGWPRRSAASRHRSFIVQQFPSNRDRSIIFLKDYFSLLCMEGLIIPKLFNDIYFLHSLRKNNDLQWETKNQSI